ncbi:hypothetical protein AACH06_03910 [Ideonella sp. DXS29W]|uniref:Uncharacterized protein n=1 Tax=Ideonella lacteola TaxID=2984193 RepID=A0ABU9BKD8_9BURK
MSASLPSTAAEQAAHRVVTVEHPQGRWMAALVAAAPNGLQLRRALAHSYDAARHGSFGLALAPQGGLYVTAWLPRAAAGSLEGPGAPSADADIESRLLAMARDWATAVPSAPGRDGRWAQSQESRVRHGLLRAR